MISKNPQAMEVNTLVNRGTYKESTPISKGVQLDYRKFSTFFTGDTGDLELLTPTDEVMKAGWNKHLLVPLSKNDKVWRHNNQEDVPNGYIRVIQSINDDKVVTVHANNSFEETRIVLVPMLYGRERSLYDLVFGKAFVDEFFYLSEQEFMKEADKNPQYQYYTNFHKTLLTTNEKSDVFIGDSATKIKVSEVYLLFGFSSMLKLKQEGGYIANSLVDRT